LAKEKTPCSFGGCNAELPSIGQETIDVRSGWTVARIEEYHNNKITLYYFYVCPAHKLVIEERQQTLFEIFEKEAST
jgi:hypothetical protein